MGRPLTFRSLSSFSDLKTPFDDQRTSCGPVRCPILIRSVATVLSVGERARSFKAVSPGMLPPLGVLVALFIAFTAAQVWNDNDRAHSVVDREASALRNCCDPSRDISGRTRRTLAQVELVRRHEMTNRPQSQQPVGQSPVELDRRMEEEVAV
jgi:hypothetical protein